MSHTTVDLPELPPLSGGEDIRRALADVDARLTAWTAAIADAQAAISMARAELAGMAQATAEVTGPESAEEPTREVEPVDASPQPEIAEKTELEPAGQAEAPIEAETPADAVPESEPEPAQMDAAEPEPEPEPVAEPCATQEEDEALLASLDPETAKAIRVMRRLSIEKKSVRQLLAEYEESRSSQAAAAQPKKSWWTRG